VLIWASWIEAPGGLLAAVGGIVATGAYLDAKLHVSKDWWSLKRMKQGEKNYISAGETVCLQRDYIQSRVEDGDADQRNSESQESFRVFSFRGGCPQTPE
jgi:hypothetical protein